jgi:hypothetical protein
LKNPDKDAWKSFTLRFRPGLKAGSIDPPQITVPKGMSEDFQSYTKTKGDMDALLTDIGSKRGEARVNQKKSQDGADPDKIASMSEAELQALFGKENTQYLQVKDAGPLYDNNGNLLTVEAAQSRLPRLKQAVLRLHVVRRDKFQPWTIYHFGFMYCVLLMPDGREFHLGKCEPPSTENLVRASQSMKAAPEINSKQAPLSQPVAK